MNPNRLLTLTFLLSALGATVHAADWNPAANLLYARGLHTATLLPSGRVLVAGGLGGSGTVPNAELYNPGANTWSDGGTLKTTRRQHTATLLPGSGKVLLVGGTDGSNSPLTSAELYNPATNAWSLTGPLTTARAEFTATLLANGKVLVAGGSISGNQATASAELYNPATGSWSPAGSLGTARRQHTAVLLPSGKVLITGGTSSFTSVLFATAELYDPATNAWTPADSLNEGRVYHTMTLLTDGRVLVAGGIGISLTALATAELYDEATNLWSDAGGLGTARGAHSATLLTDGRVLAAGGSSSFGGSATTTSTIYDPATNAWTPADDLSAARSFHTETLLPGGKVLIVGGISSSVIASADLYSGPAVLFKLGQPVPGVAGKTFSSFNPPTLNENGAIAFLGKWSGGSGIFVNGRLVGKVGDVLPGGASIYSLKDPVLDDAGRVAFPCKLASAGITAANDSAIVSNAPGGTLAIVAQEGTQAADAPVGALWKTFTSTAAPGGGGGALILGTLQKDIGGILSTTDTGLWSADSAGVLHLILQEGTTVLDGLTVKSFAVLKALSGTPGQTHAFNKVELTAKVTFTTGAQAVVRLDLP